MAEQFDSKPQPVAVDTANLAKSDTLALAAPQVDPARQAYDAAQSVYQKEVSHYWQGVDSAKRAHHKIDDLPPVYHGPEKPAGYDPPKTVKILPSVDDMKVSYGKMESVAAASHKLPHLAIDETGESDFKKAYAREAINIGAQHGLNKAETKNIVQNIYAFEDGGKGTADMLSGVPMHLTAPDAPGSTANRDARRAFHPVSTAMGYNQLLMATSLRFLDGSHAVNDRLDSMRDFKAHPHLRPGRVQELEERSKNLGALQDVAHKALMTMAQTDKGKYLDAQGKPNYTLYTDFAKSLTPGANGLSGRDIAGAMQALNLDRDIGPILQAQQLDEIIDHSLKPSFKVDLAVKSAEDTRRAAVFDKLDVKAKNAAVDEVVNIVTPAKGDPVARAEMHRSLSALVGDPAAPLTDSAIGVSTHALLDSKVIALKQRGEEGGPLSPAAVALVDKLYNREMHAPDADAYLPAAVELANLAGADTAEKMLKSGNAKDLTVNYFNQSGYEGNPIVRGRTADELLKAIHRSMHGANGSPNNYGMAEMIKAFDSQ